MINSKIISICSRIINIDIKINHIVLKTIAVRCAAIENSSGNIFILLMAAFSPIQLNVKFLITIINHYYVI